MCKTKLIIFKNYLLLVKVRTASSNQSLPKILKKKSKNFTNTSFDDPSSNVIKNKNDSATSHPDQLKKVGSDSHNRAPVKRTKQGKTTTKSRKVKPKMNVKFRDDAALQEKDVFNCSADSFLLDPDKKIEVGLVDSNYIFIFV